MGATGVAIELVRVRGGDLKLGLHHRTHTSDCILEPALLNFGRKIRSSSLRF